MACAMTCAWIVKDRKNKKLNKVLSYLKAELPLSLCPLFMSTVSSVLSQLVTCLAHSLIQGDIDAVYSGSNSLPISFSSFNKKY